MKVIYIAEAAKRLGVTVQTLQNWDKNGKLIAKRTPSNRRFYTEEQIQKILKQV